MSAGSRPAALKPPPAIPDPRVELTFATSVPKISAWLEITAPEDNEPTALYDALRAVGWAERFPPVRSHPAYEQGPPWKQLGYNVMERQFTKSGSELFGGWTAAERKTFMPEARAILRVHGFTHVPVWHKTWQDML